MERVVRERMTIQELDKAPPNALINIRPVVAAMKEFFGGSQLSQFMDQTNPLAELTSKRRLSALGRGGLSRERAGFDVGDVHHSHYGRICPIETPEGPNIGLIGSLATYGRINSYGFIETPYRRVKQTVGYDEPNLASFGAGRDLRAQGADAALNPFLEHDDANGAMMGSNMQRQAVPLLAPESPIVGTGMEERAARDSGQVLVSKRGGVVTSVTAERIRVETDSGELDEYK